MAVDLVVADPQVHDRAARILDFWFGIPRKQQFAKDPVLDRIIAERWEGLRDDLLATRADGWRDHPDTLLAAIIVLDQFSRNIHRNSPEAFAADDLAAALTLEAITHGWERRYSAEQRAFLYMPLMHAEDGPLQALSLDRFAALGDAEQLDYAQQHAAVLARYGRFPSRNAALGRSSTAAEDVYLSRPGAGW